MNTKKRLVKIVCILLPLVCFGMISFAQKTTTSKDNNGKLLPFSEFKNADIGAKTQAGTATINKDELIIVAGGSDIWGKKDEFHFSYKVLQGDFDMSVQVLSLSAANQYTKAGIMARESLDDNSRHVLYQVFPDNSARNKNNGGCEFQYRTETAGEMKAIYPDMNAINTKCEVAYPNTWIRLKRKGDIFESYFSNDNKNWRLYSTYTLKMPIELMVGLAVTAHNSKANTTAGFASVRLRK
jgi:regulation of enolase protein 1 (concanavalin A-like superfamily)